jgi:vitamin K-dependent gamma-carboxylase
MMRLLFQPIDAAILIYFRIVAAVLMAQELINALVIGKFSEYTTPSFHFSYMYFEWIKPWPYEGMVIHFGLTIISALAVAVNFHYRFFSILLFLGYSSLFLMEQAEYINHFYLYCLVSFWMMFLPLNQKKNTQPAWILYLLLFHMALVYFFGGVAKLNSDWLSGRPMNLYLDYRKDYFLGFLYSKSWAPIFFSYGGLVFDLLIVPLLLFRRTRLFGLLCSIAFHLSNVMMFGLATFPWFSILLTSMFFDPSWPRKIPYLRRFMPWNIERPQTYRPNKLLVLTLSLYVVIHLALPLRHHIYPGDPSWTEQGHMFSWRMMLRSKQGTTDFVIKDKRNYHMERVKLSDYITPRQYEDMIGKPDMILQFAHYLRDVYQKKWNSEVAVFASAKVSLNGRSKIEMINPDTDLASEKRSLENYSWIRPLINRGVAVGD